MEMTERTTTETPTIASPVRKPGHLALSMAMVFAITLMAAGPALADPGGRRGPSPERLLDRLSSELNLSEEQQDEVAPIIEAEVRKRREIVDQVSSLEQEKHREAREALAAVEEETALQLAAVLSEEQLDRFREMREEHRQRREDRRAARAEDRGRRPRNW